MFYNLNYSKFEDIGNEIVDDSISYNSHNTERLDIKSLILKYKIPLP